MTRLSMLPLDQWDAGLRQFFQADQATPLELGLMRVMAHRPALAKALAAYGAALFQNHVLPRRLIELLRLRIAFHNQCRSCMAIRYQSALEDGLTENQVCSLERPQEATDLTDAEKTAISYADLSATNHLAIDEGTFASLRRYFSEPEIVELGMFIAFFVGYGRLGATWDMVEELPGSFQNKESRASPWMGPAVTVRG